MLGVEDDERREFRRALGTTMQRVRRKLTAYSSQASIAAVLGVSGDTIGRWERGEGEPQASELVEMWRRYDVPAEWLLRPTADVNELDGWIAELRHDRLTRAAQEAARADAADETGQPIGDGR